ncbi:MAG: CpXC domain-containing protein [Verrucomicrobia bacterium]|nr:CpXC domain-containing protein [Verrucomicrobiota bacterium]
MSIARTYPIRCPKCQAEAGFELYDSVNVAEDPELRDALMGNRLNSLECPSCQFRFRVDKPLLYIDPIRGFAVWWTDEGTAQPEKAAEEYRRMQASLQEAPGHLDLKLQLVYERVELIERIFLIEAGLDERVIEYIKYLVYSKNTRKVDPASKRLLLNEQGPAGGDLCFAVQDVKTRRIEGILKYDRKMVAEVEAIFAGNPTKPLSELFPHPYVSARRLMLD